MKKIKVAILFIPLMFIILTSEVVGLSSEAKDLLPGSEMRVVRVSKNAVLTDIMGEDIVNTHYIIRHKHNLSRYSECLTIGNNCILEFRRGNFNNGRLKCGNIVIKGRKMDL